MPQPSYIIRGPHPGDYGWIAYCHGKVYGEQYGYTPEFEGLVAEVAGAFARSHDPQRERCWIAEKDGKPVGSVLLVKKSEDVGKLRLLIVDPSARGLGIGARLVDECVRFAREAGYRKVTLWTHNILTHARRI
jgi:GNAT superfamily N-acetyltransferase